MLKKILALLLSFSLFLENSYLLASRGTEVENNHYKEEIYKYFSVVEKIHDVKAKRHYLEIVFRRIKEELKKIDQKNFTKKQKASFTVVKKHFSKWQKELSQVKDEDLDRFARGIIQDTEQAIFVCFILPAIIFVVIMTALGVGMHYAFKHLRKKMRRNMRKKPLCPPKKQVIIPPRPCVPKPLPQC